MLAVVEHGAVDQPLGLLGKVFEVLVMGCNHAPHTLVVELFEYRLGNRAADLRLRAAAELVNQNQRGGTAVAEEMFHVAQMGGIGREVVLD